MTTRAQNERKFGRWEDLPQGWRARYMKEVDANETTLRFWQEIYDELGKLVETHQKHPVDQGHRKA